MCQYRYFFYPSCRHQQTVLVNYCEHATSAPIGGETAPASNAFSQQADWDEVLSAQSKTEKEWLTAKKSQKEKKGKKRKGQNQKQGNLPSATIQDNKSSASEETHNPTASSLPSITDQNSPRTSSSIVPQHEQTPEMAALRPFGLQTFFGGGNKQSSCPENDVAAQTQCGVPENHARRRQPGIRQNTDESWDLPNSSDLLQHLVDSPIGLGIRDHTNRRSAHVGQDSMYEMSDDGSQIRESFDQIEQEVDALKQEVMRLKAVNASSQHPREQQVNDTPQPQSSPAEHETLSPAEKLRKQHEQWAARPPPPPPKAQSPPAPPGPEEFPALDIAVKTPVTKQRKAAGAPLRSATASGEAQQSMSKKPAAGTRNKRADSKIPAPVSPRRVEKSDIEEDSSVIISRAAPSAPNGQSYKEGPHFAQPTKSFARRAGETLRKESLAAAMKTPGETSPTKSTKAKSPTFETDKRASTRHNKRQSLPSNWVGGMQAQQENVDVQAQMMTSGVDQHAVSADKGPRSPAVSKAAAQPQTPQVRKKASSYMSPTTATTQRAIATLGEDGAMRSDSMAKPWVADAVTNKHQSGMTAADAVIIPGSPESCASAHFENLIAGLSAPPAAAPRKPSYAEVSSRGVERPKNAARGSKQPERPRAIAGPTPAEHATPSKASKQADALNSSSDLLIRYAGETRLPAPLVSVANTTARRRTSHADILKPIFDKLDQHGLQINRPNPTNLSAPAAKAQEAAVGSLQQISPDFNKSKATTAWQAKGPLGDVARLARQGANSKATTLPPHLGAAQNAKEGGLPSEGVHVNGANMSESLSRSSSMPVAPRAVSSSLRATAKAFEPLWKADNPVKELSMLSWQGSFDYRPDEEWSGLPAQVKESIMLLRNFQKGDSRSSSPSKRSQQRFWGELMNKTVSHSSSAKTAVPGGIAPREYPMPTSFGRAPMPVFPVTQEPGLMHDTPPISPASDDTSPIKTPQNVHAWTIGSNFHPQKHPYGWKGGDGREISFSGYGPQAEIDPRNPVNMLFFPRGDAVASPGTKVSPMPRVWPKSQKQWAEYAGYKQEPPKKVQTQPQPCGNMEFVSATEHMPGSSEEFGYCSHCAQ